MAGIDITVVKPTARQGDAVAAGEEHPGFGQQFAALVQGHGVGVRRAVDDAGFLQRHRVGGDVNSRLLGQAMDRLHAAQQDAVQPVIVQRVVAAGQLVLIDKGVERVRREGVHLPCQRHRRQVAVHVAHVEAVGGPAVVGGKGNEVPEVVVFKVEAGKGQAAELPAGSQLLPGRVGQLGGVLVISGIVVGGVTLGKLGTQAKALGGGADSQQHSGRGTVPEPQHQPAGRHGQQHAGQPGQTGAAGEHGPEIHQHLRDGHGKQRAAPEGDGVAHRGDGVQHQQHNSGNHNMGMAAEELCRFFALYQQTGQCQHDGRGGAQARVHFLFPAGTQTRHKQVG